MFVAMTVNLVGPVLVGLLVWAVLAYMCGSAVAVTIELMGGEDELEDR